MSQQKTELAVAALRNGTVIDHIPCEAVYKAVRILRLEDAGTAVTIGNNLPSDRMGRKGIIKVADRFFDESDLDRIAIIAPTAWARSRSGPGGRAGRGFQSSCAGP